MASPDGLDRALAPWPTAARDASVAARPVVVGQFFALADVARGTNPDDVPDHVRVAVGFARVIEEPRDVPADGGIADPSVVDLETPDVSLGELGFFAGPALTMSDLLARVVHDARILRNRLAGVHAPAGDLRLAAFDRLEGL